MARKDDYCIPAGVRRRARAQTAQGERIVVSPQELVKFLDRADRALNGDSNDAEHDALYDLRAWASDVLEDPDRRTKLWK